jgi:hypothetical protein
MNGMGENINSAHIDMTSEDYVRSYIEGQRQSIHFPTEPGWRRRQESIKEEVFRKIVGARTLPGLCRIHVSIPPLYVSYKSNYNFEKGEGKGENYKLIFHLFMAKEGNSYGRCPLLQ